MMMIVIMVIMMMVIMMMVIMMMVMVMQFMEIQGTEAHPVSPYGPEIPAWRLLTASIHHHFPDIITAPGK